MRVRCFYFHAVFRECYEVSPDYRVCRLYERVNGHIEAGTRMSERAFIADSNRLRLLEDRMKTAGASPSQQNPLAQFKDYGDYASKFTGNMTYAQQLRDVQSKAEQLHQEYVRSGKVMEDYGKRMKVLQEEARVLKTEMKAIPDLMSGTAESTSYLGSFRQKFRKMCAA